MEWLPIILIVLYVVILKRIAKKRRLRMEELKRESEYENIKRAYVDALKEYENNTSK